MSNISAWSETAANNNAAAPNGFPEGMAPSGVNDGCREIMGAVRRWTDDGGWHNWGDTCNYNSATSFVITGVDATARYHTGRRIRAVGTVTGTIYGTVSSSSFVSDTTVNVTWDSGSLASESLTISLGFLAVVNTPIPAILLAGNQTAAGVKTFSSFPVGPSAAPTTDYQLSNKKYIDDTIAAAIAAYRPFKVGSVYINITGVNPATELGYGTWSQISQGQMLVGQKTSDSDFTTAEQTGGAKTKNISHTHSTPAHNHDYTEPSGGALRDGVKYSNSLWINPEIGILQSNNNGSGTSGSGGSTSQDVLNPYFVVYVWKRTA